MINQNTVGNIADTETIPAISPFVNAPVNSTLTKEQKIGIYRMMMRIRRFEERSLRAYQAGKIGGFLHLYIGQEAVAAGCCSVMQKDDHIITAYRDHGHAIGVGMDTKALMAELYGKVTGCSKGKGGSMHFFDPARNFWGGHGIVGGQIPLGAGLAFGLKYLERKGAAMAFMGDGAVNQGAVHEAFNLAALWNLPVVFIIENNRYSMGTSQERSSAGHSLAQRAAGYSMAWDVCNGHDVYEVREKIDKYLMIAREEFKPSVLEIGTYRYRGHSVADPDKTYRSKKEIEDYQRIRDPLNLFLASLHAEGAITDDVAAAIDTEARAEADLASEFAEASPYPTIDDITRDIYWEEDNPEHKVSQGRIIFD
ncbi:MAG: pyruvate dehydrogenase (acetyl-transferring) E1 component subunit alpha [Opitutaceae bacterium]